MKIAMHESLYRSCFVLCSHVLCTYVYSLLFEVHRKTQKGCLIDCSGISFCDSLSKLGEERVSVNWEKKEAVISSKKKRGAIHNYQLFINMRNAWAPLVPFYFDHHSIIYKDQAWFHDHSAAYICSTCIIWIDIRYSYSHSWRSLFLLPPTNKHYVEISMLECLLSLIWIIISCKIYIYIYIYI